MQEWDFSSPTLSTMGDHDVPKINEYLLGKNVAILVSGGIAAYKVPAIARALRRFGARVRCYVSADALKYVTKATLEWCSNNSVVDVLTSNSEHLNKNEPFDAYLLVPATYNSINKFANGIADSVISTTLSSALGLLERGLTKILVAPTMHGDMHNSILKKSMTVLAEKGVEFLKPRDLYGKNNIPDTKNIVYSLCRSLGKNDLNNMNILVTAGPTPVPLDNVRRITNRFRGRLGLEIATQLWIRGANVKLILGGGFIEINTFIPTVVISDFESYRTSVIETLNSKKYDYGIFSAAVADYQPPKVHEGKIPSGDKKLSLDLVPTPKVIDEVRAKFPTLKLISFKYEVGKSHTELIEIAKSRLKMGHFAVVANRYDEMILSKDQIAYLITDLEKEPEKMIGKSIIATSISDLISLDVSPLDRKK